jgi:hypothetical protein
MRNMVFTDGGGDKLLVESHASFAGGANFDPRSDDPVAVLTTYRDDPMNGQAVYISAEDAVDLAENLLRRVRKHRQSLAD